MNEWPEYPLKYHATTHCASAAKIKQTLGSILAPHDSRTNTIEEVREHIAEIVEKARPCLASGEAKAGAFAY